MTTVEQHSRARGNTLPSWDDYRWTPGLWCKAEGCLHRIEWPGTPGAPREYCPVHEEAS